MTLVDTLLPPRKKIVIRLPKLKPTIEPPPHQCRLCEEVVAAWWFPAEGHPDICSHCADRAERGRPPEFRERWWSPDAYVVACATAVIKELRRGP
jgi:hypothetical protein